MKLSRPPRLFGSTTAMTDNNIMDKKEDGGNGPASKYQGVVDRNRNSKSAPTGTTTITSQKNQFRKSPLAALKSKLTSRSSTSATCTTNAGLKRDVSKRSTETSSPENSNAMEEDVVEDNLQPQEQEHQEQGENDNGDNDDDDDADTLSVEQDKDPLASATPVPPRRRTRSRLGPPKSLFQPPPEVMIDPDAVPPSPMKDPTVHNMVPRTATDQPLQPSPYPGLLMDVPGSNSNDDTAQPYCLGDPLGDIAMKRQLLDAQRLVRLILGKPLCGDQQLLETTTILQAIRSFAMMKQELVDLRKKQEIMDDDPPAILQMLGSPAGTTPTSVTTGYRTGTPSTAFSFQNKLDDSSDEVDVTRDLLPSHSATLDEANTKIESLQQQLAACTETIRNMQQEKVEQAMTGAQPSPEPALDDCQQESCCQHRQSTEIKYRRLVKVHEAAVEESQRNLDAVIDSVASVPKRVLAKDSVREKLKAYCTTITNHASQLQVVEMEERIQREREESQRIIQELQAKILSQEESSGGKIDTTLFKESLDHICDVSVTSATDTEQNSITLGLQEEKKVDA
ncbi:MAG: hypothetical protein SGILL_002913 [Bacillariaceae sp.]